MRLYDGSQSVTDRNHFDPTVRKKSDNSAICRNFCDSSRHSRYVGIQFIPFRNEVLPQDRQKFNCEEEGDLSEHGRLVCRRYFSSSKSVFIDFSAFFFASESCFNLAQSQLFPIISRFFWFKIRIDGKHGKRTFRNDFA